MLILHEVGTAKPDKDRDIIYKKNVKNFDWRLNASKRDLTRRLFLNQADTTYISARFQFFSGMYFEYYWNSVHALEKYLKAILLMNGHATKNLGHKITDAFDKVQTQLGKELIPDVFPEILTNKILKIIEYSGNSKLLSEGPRSFISRLEQYGGPNSRYGLKEASIFISDIYCLDLTVFILRRAVEDLNDPKKLSETIDNPTICPSRYGTLEEIFIKETEPAKKWAERCNYFLSPSPDFTKAINGGIGFAFNSNPLYNHIVENAEKDSEMHQQLSSELSKWVLENIQVDKGLKSDLKTFIK